jgi:hypothetical protein
MAAGIVYHVIVCSSLAITPAFVVTSFLETSSPQNLVLPGALY